MKQKLISLAEAHGYIKEKNHYGYHKLNRNVMHWITFFGEGNTHACKIQMYAYHKDDTQMDKIYDTGIVVVGEPELKTLIKVFL